MTFPAMLKTTDGYFLILKADTDKCLIVTEESNAPKIISMEKLCEIWHGEILLFIPRMMSSRDIKFGFKWFIPTIIKYKTPLIEVLFAALFMLLQEIIFLRILQAR